MGNCAGRKIEGQPIQLDKMGVSTLDKERERLYAMSSKEQKAFLNDQMMNRQLTSGINLQAIFFVTVPIKGAYKLDFKMNYSVNESTWTEDKLRNKDHKSRPCQFQYLLHADKQDVSLPDSFCFIHFSSFVFLFLKFIL